MFFVAPQPSLESAFCGIFGKDQWASLGADNSSVLLRLTGVDEATAWLFSNGHSCDCGGTLDFFACWVRAKKTPRENRGAFWIK